MRKLLVISWVLLATILPVTAETDISPLLGTWVNPQYDAERQAPWFVYKPDGTLEGYATTYAAEPTHVYTYTVEEEWKDPEGVYWYKLVATLDWRFYYLLIRISPDGMTYEEDQIRENLREFPSVINPKSYFYATYYRE